MSQTNTKNNNQIYIISINVLGKIKNFLINPTYLFRKSDNQVYRLN